MHISAIRTYIVELEGGEEKGLAKLFPGEVIYSVLRLYQLPQRGLSRFKVETTLPIQGQGEAWTEPVEKVEGSISFSGEAPDEGNPRAVASDVVNIDHFEQATETAPKDKE